MLNSRILVFYLLTLVLKIFSDNHSHYSLARDLAASVGSSPNQVGK